MNKYFLLFIILLNLFLSRTVKCQDVYKFKAKYVSTQIDGAGSWSTWDDCNVLIVLDFNEERVSMYANKTHTLDFYKWKVIDDNKVDGIELNAIDENGISCKVSFVIFKNDSEDKRLLVYYKNYSICYAVKNLTNY